MARINKGARIFKFARVAGLSLAILIGQFNPALAGTYALVIGVNDYGSGNALAGAVADAKDIAASLRTAGAGAVTLLIEREANRTAVLRELAALAARVKPGDTAIITFAGLGTTAPVETVTAAPAVASKVLLLAGYESGQPLTSAGVLLRDVLDVASKIERAGAQALMVMDTSFGALDIRDVDARVRDKVSYRSATAHGVAALKKAPPDAADKRQNSDAAALNRSVLLEAGSAVTTVPEIEIPGENSARGALSYSIARAIEGAATEIGPRIEDGAITLDDLVTYAGRVAYQLSDQRQQVVVSGGLESRTQLGLTRSIKQVAGPGMPPPGPSVQPDAADAKRKGEVLPIAALDGRADHFAGLTPLEVAFSVVRPSENPGLIWDQSTRDVIVGGDVIAYAVSKTDIPAIVDRVVAVRKIKQLTAQAPQPMLVAPTSALHHHGDKVTVDIEDVANRALILLNITGDGTVQLLYPIGSDPPVMTKPSYRLELSVQGPYGADQIVAITAPQRMTDLEQAFNRLKDRRASGQIARVVTSYAPAKTRFGSVGIFTAR
jgi:Caspase domain